MLRMKPSLSLFFSISLLLSAVSCGYHPPETAEVYDPKNNPDHRLDLTSEDKITELYQAMKDIHEVFTRCNVPYFADSGTLLGAVRNKGIIPWDDDHDLGVLSQDIPKILVLRPLLDELGYVINDVFFGYKIKRKNELEATVDIFKMQERDGKISYAHGSWGTREVIDPVTGESKKRNIFINRNELYPLKLIDFGPLKVFAPNNPTLYLNAYYRNWQNVAFTYGHSGQRKFKVDLNIHTQFRAPAPLHPETLEPIDITARLKDRVPSDLKCPDLKRDTGHHFPFFFDGV